jgi:hypothetical protein
VVSLAKEGDENLRKGEDRIQSQAVGKLSRTYSQKGLGMASKKGLYLFEKIIPVRIEGKKGIIEIPLKHTIGAIHWTVRDGIDHMISAADMARRPRTGL